MDKLPDLTKLTSEQKDTLILILWKENQKLKELVHQLEMKVKALEERINRNSSNSQKPPSSDVFKKFVAKKPKSDKKSGDKSDIKAELLRLHKHPMKLKSTK